MKSLISYRDRGPYGDAKYPGNTSGRLVKDLLRQFRPKRVLDPMCGSNTTGDVCRELGLPYLGLDLKTGFDLLTSPIPGRFDFIFWHPPYWNMVRYSREPADFSNAPTYDEWLEWMRRGFRRLLAVLLPGGHLALQIGDLRRRGRYYFMAGDCYREFGEPLSSLLIKEQHNMRSDAVAYSGRTFIPIVHEYVLIYQKVVGQESGGRQSAPDRRPTPDRLPQNPRARPEPL